MLMVRRGEVRAGVCHTSLPLMQHCLVCSDSHTWLIAIISKPIAAVPIQSLLFRQSQRLHFYPVSYVHHNHARKLRSDQLGQTLLHSPIPPTHSPPNRIEPTHIICPVVLHGGKRIWRRHNCHVVAAEELDTVTAVE